MFPCADFYFYFFFFSNFPVKRANYSAAVSAYWITPDFSSDNADMIDINSFFLVRYFEKFHADKSSAVVNFYNIMASLWSTLPEHCQKIILIMQNMLLEIFMVLLP